MAEDRGRRLVRAIQAYVTRRITSVRRELRSYPTTALMKAMIADALGKIETIRGEDGKSVTVEDVRPMIELQLTKFESETERRCQARIDSAIEAVHARLASLPTAEDIDRRAEAWMGRLGVEIEMKARAYFEQIAAGLPTPKDGRDGDSIEGVSFSVDGDGILTISLTIAGITQEHQVPLNLPHNGGVYRNGQPYRSGAIVSYAGSAFIATRDVKPTEKPEQSDAWRLFVKRGRDGKDAE